MTSHTKGPWLGDHTAAGGIYKDVGGVDLVRGPYKIWIEEFGIQMIDSAGADLGLLGRGATVTDVGGPTSPSEVVVGATPYLLLNPGTSVDDGIEVQFNEISTGATTSLPGVQTPGPITSTTTLMDNKEIWFQTRVGFQTDAALNFDGHVLIGWFANDIALLAPTTGIPTVIDGGGFGFYINGDDGNPAAVNIIPVSDGAAIIVAPVRGTNSVPTSAVLPDLAVDLAVAGQFYWYTLGAKMRVVDASAFTGVTTFYINGREIGTVVDSTCMDSTQVYSMSYAVHNGPIDTVDLAVDYMAMGITREGLTFPYDSDADVASI